MKTAIAQDDELYDEGNVTAELDAVYGKEPAGVDPVLAKMQGEGLPEEGW